MLYEVTTYYLVEGEEKSTTIFFDHKKQVEVYELQQRKKFSNILEDKSLIGFEFKEYKDNQPLVIWVENKKADVIKKFLHHNKIKFDSCGCFDGVRFEFENLTANQANYINDCVKYL